MMSSETANKPSVNDLTQEGQTRDVSGVDAVLATLALTDRQVDKTDTNRQVPRQKTK